MDKEVNSINDSGIYKGMKYSELIKLYPSPLHYFRKYKTLVSLKHRWNNGELSSLLTSMDIATELKIAMDEIGEVVTRFDRYNTDLLCCAGSYCHRKVRGRDEWSVHAYGLAVDINPHMAPYKQMSRQPHFIVDIMKKYGFLWGGDYPSSYIDGMHFSWIREGC